MVEKRPALGRGLSALIPDTPLSPQTSARTLEVDTDLLTPNRFQPRTPWTTDESRSSRDRSAERHHPAAHRPRGGRRLRAHRRRTPLARLAARRPPQSAGHRTRHARDRMLEMALIENLQREDLNPWKSRRLRRLAEEFPLKQEEIADPVGKDRSSVANMTRLLRSAPRGPRECRRRHHRHGPRPRALEPSRRGLAASLGPRGRLEAALGSRNRSARQESADAGHASRGAAERRPHARRRGPPPLRARHPRPHRAQAKRRKDRSRLRLGRRAAAALRPDGRQEIDAGAWCSPAEITVVREFLASLGIRALPGLGGIEGAGVIFGAQALAVKPFKWYKLMFCVVALIH